MNALIDIVNKVRHAKRLIKSDDFGKYYGMSNSPTDYMQKDPGQMVLTFSLSCRVL